MIVGELEAGQNRIEAELCILRAMCQGTPERTAWDEGMLILSSYPFRDSIHQLVFDILREISSRSPRVIREELPRRVVNKGFPDLDLDTYFQPHNLNASQVISLMHAVRAAACGEAKA